MRSVLKKVNYKDIILFILIVFLFFWGYQSWTENKHYEEYLSHDMSNELSKVVYGSQQTQSILEEVISTETLTVEQAENLSRGYMRIVQYAQKYETVANHFLERIDKEAFSNKTANLAADCGYYFMRLSDDLDQPISLDQTEIEKYKTLKKFSDAWYQTAQVKLQKKSHSTLKESGISSELWIEYLLALQKDTVETAKKHMPEHFDEENIDSYLKEGSMDK